jgi:hypothetical protein
MAAEERRGCGYRKVGGLYLIGSGAGAACDRLPLPLGVCPTCGHGIKPTRGFTWVDVPTLVGGDHLKLMLPQTCSKLCDDPLSCPLCHNTASIGRAGLLWIGAQFYPTIEAFAQEAQTQGISRRIMTLPNGFKVGETWILLAHARAIRTEVAPEGGLGLATEIKYGPGIFRVWRPERLERIFKESDRGSEKVVADEKRCITPVFVPDDDADHQGSPYKKEKTS